MEPDLSTEWEQAIAEIFLLVRRSGQRQASKRYYAANKGMVLSKARAEYQAHRDAYRAAARAYRAINSDAVKAKQRRWRLKNPEYHRQRNLRRKAKALSGD